MKNQTNKIDLRNCETGDLLFSSLGARLVYIRPTNDDEYLDHLVKYINIPNVKCGYNCFGTRTHDGFTFAKNRKPETDHDIIEVIKVKGLFGKN